MTHANTLLIPEGSRRLAHLVVEEGWPMRRAADLMLLLCVKGGEVLVVAVCELG